MKTILLLKFILSNNFLIDHVRKNNPNLTYEDTVQIAFYTYKHSTRHGVDPKTMSSIIMIESAYIIGRIGSTNDYGIGQINLHNIHYYNMDVLRLLFDLEYSISNSVKVFKYFNNRFKGYEAVVRYNCGLRVECVNWKSSKLYKKLFKRYYE